MYSIKYDTMMNAFLKKVIKYGMNPPKNPPKHPETPVPNQPNLNFKDLSQPSS